MRVSTTTAHAKTGQVCTFLAVQASFTRTIPPPMIRLEEPERPSHISGIPGCCQNGRTYDREDRFRNRMSIRKFTLSVFPFSSEWDRKEGYVE